MTRARWFGGVVTAIALMMGAAASLPYAAAASATGADGCPTSWPGPWGVTDRPGPLIPAEDVVAVTLCELVIRPPARQSEARRLTGSVAEMVAVLNAMPTRDQLEVTLRAQEQAAGRTLPEDLHLGEVCTAVGYGDVLSFAVHYRQGPPVVVLMDRNCGTAHHAGRTRFLDGQPIDVFLGFYREQLVRPPATITEPVCPATLAPGQLDISTFNNMPADGIARNRGNIAPFLPSTLAALTACRYEADGPDLVLRQHITRREALEPLRVLLNTATTVEVTTDDRGGERFANGADCGDLGRALPVTALDTIWVADVTGAVAELRIRRAPCQAVHRAGRGGLVPKPALLDQLDAWLSR